MLGQGVAAASSTAACVVRIGSLCAGSGCARPAASHHENIQTAVPVLPEFRDVQKSAAFQLKPPVAVPIVDFFMLAGIGVGHDGTFHRQGGNAADHASRPVCHHAVDAVRSGLRQIGEGADGSGRAADRRSVPKPLIGIGGRSALLLDFHLEHGVSALAPHRYIRRIGRA